MLLQRPIRTSVFSYLFERFNQFLSLRSSTQFSTCAWDPLQEGFITAKILFSRALKRALECQEVDLINIYPMALGVQITLLILLLTYIHSSHGFALHRAAQTSISTEFSAGTPSTTICGKTHLLITSTPKVSTPGTKGVSDKAI